MQPPPSPINKGFPPPVLNTVIYEHNLALHRDALFRLVLIIVCRNYRYRGVGEGGSIDSVAVSFEKGKRIGNSCGLKNCRNDCVKFVNFWKIGSENSLIIGHLRILRKGTKFILVSIS